MTVAPHQLQNIASDVDLGIGVTVHSFVNLYGCRIGAGTTVGAFVEVQRGATIGERCKISSHAFVCEGVTIEDEVFIGHGVTFINDRYPRSCTAEGKLQAGTDWQCARTRVERGASIGSNATVLGGIVIGEGAMVGAGSVVTHDVAAHATVAGNPAVPMKTQVGLKI